MQEKELTPLLLNLKHNLLLNYQPGTIPAKTIMMSTNEVFNAMQSIYPSDTYTAIDIATWLFEGGFKYTDVGNMRWQWILQPYEENNI